MQASIELAKEKADLGHLLNWANVKVIAPPAGPGWVWCVKILGFYDNLPFGKRMSFADNMIFLRREYVDLYQREDGVGYKNEEDKPALLEKA